MQTAQSSHVPAEGTKPKWPDLPWLAIFSVRGFLELVRARIIFARLSAKEIRQRNRSAKKAATDAPNVNERLLERMAYVLPRLSDRLPWRSDCLIQAVAAQNWLKSRGAASEIRIGVEIPEGGEFGAHAWLVHGERIITGGDIDRYDLLLSESRINGRSDP